MTVNELIQHLSQFDGNLRVEIGMNQEYQMEISAEDVRVERGYPNEQEQYLFIGD